MDLPVITEEDHCGCCGGIPTEPPKGEHGPCCGSLHDLHYCPLCQDVVGHSHFHEVPLTPEHAASIVQVISDSPLEGT